MASPRWRKLLGDVRSARGRILLMIAAIAASLVAVGGVLGAYAVLGREIAVNYQGTRPASATLEVDGGVDAALLAELRGHPLVQEAEARDVIAARVRVGNDWRRLLLFVIDDFADLRLNRFRPEAGAWPPPAGTMLIERTAVSMLEATTGQRVLVKTPHGDARAVEITGLVHDPGLAPAWQERSGYAYVSRETLGLLGEPPVLGELRVALAGQALDSRAIETQAEALAGWLAERGRPVTEIRVPPPARHPHQTQMETILLMMLVFSLMALLLSAILGATSLTAMLARQVREIGVMKTVGASGGQIAGLYAVLVGAIGLVAALVAIPLGILGARVLAGSVAGMLNFTLTSTAIPWWVFAAQAAGGILVPLLVAAVPIRRASRTTVRQAIDDHGVSSDRLRARLGFLPAPLRNAVRRPARLALTLGLLAAGGAMFMTAINVEGSWRAMGDKMAATRSYDVDVKLLEAQPVELAERLRRRPGVRTVEAWGFSPAALAHPGHINVAHTYPDQGHGSFAVMAPPVATELIRFPVQAGRWLSPTDRKGVVLNHVAAAQTRAGVGSSLPLSFGGQTTTLRVVGIVEEVGSAAVAYVTPETFAQATGTAGRARMLRIATDAGSPEQRIDIIRNIEQDLDDAGAGVESAMALSELRTAVGDHIVILIRALIAMAVILAIVGILGLGSTMSLSVVERTRELGVMKTLGATPRRIIRLLVTEGLAIGLLSWLLAFAGSIPLTLLVDWLVGNLGFLAPLPLVLSPGAAALWLGLVAAVSLAATLVPARRASALVIREALART